MNTNNSATDTTATITPAFPGGILLVTTPVAVMARATVYLDGAFRGYAAAPEISSWSFDHHGEGARFPLMSSCLQLAVALRLGCPVKATTHRVVVSSIDADSILSVLLLLRPELAADSGFADLLREVSEVDGNGPLAAIPGEPPLGVFSLLRPARGEEASTQTLLRLVEVADRAERDGSLYRRGTLYRHPGVGVGMSEKGVRTPIMSFEGRVSSQDVYGHDSGPVISLLVGDKVTVSKLPFAAVPSFATLWPFLTERFQIGAWGGADSIGGSPFKPTGAMPEPLALVDAIRDWLGHPSKKDWVD